MHRTLNTLLLGLLVVVGGERAAAFSLLGPFASWQTATIGYQLGGDIGGPMNLGEEYRWNIPLITYGFDSSFLNYFGTNGVADVEWAFQVLNNLPAFSQMNPKLTEFPLDTRRFNYQAEALNLLSLRSWVLGELVEQLGLAAPDRYVWTLRARQVVNNVPYYLTIERNFDPITWEPSLYVNGELYTYQIVETYPTPTWESVPYGVNPSVPNVSAVADIGISGGTVAAPGFLVAYEPGLLFTGLTRDDVGGLRYIYLRNNENVETLPTNTISAPLGTTTGLIGTGSTSSPWGSPVFTNTTGTNVVGVTNSFINQALRPGIDKFNFVRVDYDSLLGAWTLVTNVWTDHYITNYTSHSQTVARTLSEPDILFAAADLGVATTIPTPVLMSRTNNFVNNSALNGVAGLDGPGTMSPPTVILVSKLGASYLNPPGSSQGTAFPMLWWGSFNISTNTPIVYPSGTSIRAIENLVLTGQGDQGLNPWLEPAYFQGQTNTTGTTTTTPTTGTGGGSGG